MSRATLSPGIETLRGKLARKSGMQMRIKTYRNDSGEVIKYGPQEYFKRESRDYKHSPRTEAEQAQATIWRTACREASLIIKDKSHPRYADLRARWNAQFDGHPEPLFQVPGKPKVIYGMFPVFVRMVLLREEEKE